MTIYGHTTLDSTPLTLSLKCELSEHYYHIWTYISLDSTPLTLSLNREGNDRLSREELAELLGAIGSPPCDGSLWSFEELAHSAASMGHDGEVDAGMLLSATWEHRMRVIHWVEGITGILTHRLQGLSAAEMIEYELLSGLPSVIDNMGVLQQYDDHIKAANVAQAMISDDGQKAAGYTILQSLKAANTHTHTMESHCSPYPWMVITDSLTPKYRTN